MFAIEGDPQKRVAEIIGPTRKAAFKIFPNFIASSGPPLEHRVMAYLGRHQDGTVEGYAVKWGDAKAGYGRGPVTINPGGKPGFDLDLDEHHPGLKSAK